MSQLANSPVQALDRKYVGSCKISDYAVEQKLGEGTFGEVYKARTTKLPGVFALKKILMHNEKDGFPITALREIKLLKMLSHENIIRLEEMAVERTTDKKKATLYMVFPYMEHDLSGLLDNKEIRLNVPIIKCYMKQLLQGLQYLHASAILHRDMKAANLLISNRGILKIADFGLARHYDEPPPQAGRGNGEARRDYTTLVVTRWYRPPELLLQLRKYTPAIDMWGSGCVFGEMFKRKPILSGKTDLNQAEIIFQLVGTPTEENMPGWQELPGCEGVKQWTKKAGEYQPGNLKQVFRELTPDAISLLSDLLTLNWRTRVNAIDALKHPFFTTHPLPLEPHQIPRFSDSHELDRRQNGHRGGHQELPPAPQGGMVGGGRNGDWAPNGPPHYPAGSASSSGRSRIPQAANNLPPPPNGSQHALPRRPDGLPARADPYARGHPRDHDRRPMPPRNGGPDVDVYIPDYQNRPPPPRRMDRRSMERDDRYSRPTSRGGDEYEYDRRPPPRLDYDDPRPSQRRTRSRSPERRSMEPRDRRDRDNRDVYRR